jgi:hypothetical protein
LKHWNKRNSPSAAKNIHAERRGGEHARKIACQDLSTGNLDNALGLSIGPDGGLLGVINESLYRIDRTNGAATLIGNTGFAVLSGLAFVDEIDRLSPCGGPWQNHGEYVSSVAQITNDLHKAGIITGKQKGQLQAQAAQSDCGK